MRIVPQPLFLTFWHPLQTGMHHSKHFLAQTQTRYKPFARSEKEQALTILGPWQDRAYFDAKCPQGWRAMKRFAVWQDNAQDFRVIDNGLSNGINSAASMNEKIHTTSTQVSVAISQLMYKYETCLPRRAHKRATRDMTRAHRQLPITEEHQHIQIVCAFNPSAGRWQYAELKGLAFGFRQQCSTLTEYLL